MCVDVEGENTENNFKDENEVEDTDSGVSKKMAKKYKRIYNPLTKRYYKAEVNPDGSYKIVGLWSPPKKKTKKKRKKETSIWDIFD